MSFSISTHSAPGVRELDPTLYTLADDRGNVAEIWPALGFNCLSWRTRLRNSTETLDLLYRDPNLFVGARPTRSGVPVLFPFPNRIRDGRFSYRGRAWSLPINDPAIRNSIHGFACRRPWRVIGSGADSDSAFVTGEFRCSIDDPSSLQSWPADHILRLTIRLKNGSLRFEAEVINPDILPLPFGLGYHPYFALPFAKTSLGDESRIEVPGKSYWELDGNLPSGVLLPVDAARDLNRPRKFAELELDDVLTQLPERAPRVDGLIERAAIASAGATLRIFCSPSYREMVVFTPPHRQAFCVEPYTCTTDAINLQPRGLDAGWLELAPGQTWTSVVEFWV
jgi:aldose 1-epimerase